MSGLSTANFAARSACATDTRPQSCLLQGLPLLVRRRCRLLLLLLCRRLAAGVLGIRVVGHQANIHPTVFSPSARARLNSASMIGSNAVSIRATRSGVPRTARCRASSASV